MKGNVLHLSIRWERSLSSRFLSNCEKSREQTLCFLFPETSCGVDRCFELVFEECNIVGIFGEKPKKSMSKKSIFQISCAVKISTTRYFLLLFDVPRFNLIYIILKIFTISNSFYQSLLFWILNFSFSIVTSLLILGFFQIFDDTSNAGNFKFSRQWQMVVR